MRVTVVVDVSLCFHLFLFSVFYHVKQYIKFLSLLLLSRQHPLKSFISHVTGWRTNLPGLPGVPFVYFKPSFYLQVAEFA